MKSLLRTSIPASIAALCLFLAVPALAAEPADVVPEIRDDGVFIESGSDLSDEQASDLVALVRNQGERFSIVVLTEDPGSGAVAFGDAVVDRLGSNSGLVFVLTPDDVGVAGTGEVFTLEEIDIALDAAVEAGGSDADYATTFVSALTGEPLVSAPATTLGSVSEPVAPASPASGGGFGFLWFIVIVGGIGLLIFWMVKRSKKQQALSTENELAAARAEIQTQVDALANDILDMEDEVRMADSDRIDALYNEAGETYRNASEALGSADTPGEFLDITNDLDLAIWQLDSAEALLDGKEPPPKPEPKRLEPVAVPSQGPRPSTGSGGGPLGVPPRPTGTSGGYTRRSSRRSGSLSPSVIEMLITLGAGALASRGRRTRMPTAGTTPGQSTSSRSGGGFLPSPSRRGTTSSRSSRSTRSSRSSRRGTGGRIRTGRKRRK